MSDEKPPVLCYVDAPWAYFTTRELDKQWGDDWDDAPYEHNAEEPYYPHENSEDVWEIIKVAFDGDWETPASLAGGNSQYTVEQINAGAIAWLTTSRWHTGPAVAIQAGTTLPDFYARIVKGGGNVYIPNPDII